MSAAANFYISRYVPEYNLYIYNLYLFGYYIISSIVI